MGKDEDPTISASPTPEAREGSRDARLMTDKGTKQKAEENGKRKTSSSAASEGPSLKIRTEDILTAGIGEHEIDYQTQKNLYDRLAQINAQVAKLSFVGESRRALFDQIRHVTEVCGKRLDGSQTIFENSQQVNLALRAIEVYQGLLLRGLGYTASNGGTKEALVDLTNIPAATEFIQGSGFGLFNRLVETGERVSKGMLRLLVRQGDRTVTVSTPIDYTSTEIKIITTLFQEAGVQSWSQARFNEEIKKMEEVKNAVATAIGLKPFEDLADRGLAAIPNPEAGPESEAGGLDAFENHRRIKFEELIGQTNSDAHKSLQDKWQDLSAEQQLELWLRSYDLAAEDMFEEIAKKMVEEKETKEAEKGTHISRGERLKEKGNRLKRSGRKVTPEMVGQANIRHQQLATRLTNLREAFSRLRTLEGELLLAIQTETEKQKLYDLLSQEIKNSSGVLKKGPLPEQIAGLERIRNELAQASATRAKLEAEKNNLYNSYFSGKQEISEIQDFIDKIENETETAKREAELLSRAEGVGHLEASETELKKGEELERLGQIVEQKNTIKGKVDGEWLQELDILIKQGKLDQAYGFILELIFESTGSASEQLKIDFATQRQFLSQAKIVQVVMETLDLDTRQLTDDEKKDLNRAFVKIAPFLSRNLVQTQRVMGALIDRLYEDAYHDRLDEVVTGNKITPSPTEQPRMRMEVEEAAPAEIPRATESVDWGDNAINIRLEEAGDEFNFSFLKKEDKIKLWRRKKTKDKRENIEPEIEGSDLTELLKNVEEELKKRLLVMIGRHFVEDFKNHREFLRTAFPDSITLKTRDGEEYSFYPFMGIVPLFGFRGLNRAKQEEICHQLGEKILEAWFARTRTASSTT